MPSNLRQISGGDRDLQQQNGPSKIALCEQFVKQDYSGGVYGTGITELEIPNPFASMS
jgi:hypothetical protein